MSAKLTIVYWRDIPSQVIAQKGRERFSLPLSDRFEKAIDAAAMLAGASSSEAYMEHWRKVAVACSDDLETEAQLAARQLEADFDAETLRDLIKAKGLKEASS